MIFQVKKTKLKPKEKRKIMKFDEFSKQFKDDESLEENKIEILKK